MPKVEGVTLTDDSVFDEAKQEYSSAEEKLIAFVSEQIELMNEKLLFSGEEPSFYQLNQSLATFESVALGLTSLYANVRASRDFAQEAYDDYYALRFCEVRDARKATLGKDYSSTKEIDMYVRKTYMKELSKLKAECITLESKRSFVERLVQNWNSYQWVLGTLSRNAQAEASASTVSRDKSPFDEDN